VKIQKTKNFLSTHLRLDREEKEGRALPSESRPCSFSWTRLVTPAGRARQFSTVFTHTTQGKYISWYKVFHLKILKKNKRKQIFL
jgi:hypothetical protein